MPVYAKCRVNENGEPTFGSHEVSIDENGDVYFGTIPIGVHTSVEVKDDTVNIGGIQQTMPCLFATQKIWTRNTDAIAAIKRLFAEGRLHNSWELHNKAYTFLNGKKTITDYEFVGNTLLGYEYADPAYGESAKVLSISEADLMVAETFIRNFISQKEEDENLKNDSNVTPDIANEENAAPETPVAEQNTEPETPVESPVSAEGTENPESPAEDGAASTDGEAVDPVSDENPAESAALTSNDIHYTITHAASILLGKWCWVAFVYPEEHRALLETDDRADELSYVQVSYSVAEDDTLTVSDPVDVKLVVSISEINTKVAELNDAIASLNTKLVKAQEEIKELTPYREAAEKAELEAKRAELRNYVESSKQFTEEELNSGEIRAMIDNVDMAGVKAMIADRVVSAQSAAATVETSQRVTNASIAGAEDPRVNPLSVMHKFLSNR